MNDTLALLALVAASGTSPPDLPTRMAAQAQICQIYGDDLPEMDQSLKAAGVSEAVRYDTLKVCHFYYLGRVYDYQKSHTA